eukprot:jgi/Chrzof1/14328/UNPLg00601.t1
MPYTNDNTMVTCAADGQVRVNTLPEGVSGKTVSSKQLAKHDGRVHKLALDPLSPQHCFYSCGEDGEVFHFDLRASGSSRCSKLLVCHGYSERRGSNTMVVDLNCIHVNPARPWQFAVGGSDEWVRVYDYRRYPGTSSSTAEASSSSRPAVADNGTRSSSRRLRDRLFSLSDEPVMRLCLMG